MTDTQLIEELDGLAENPRSKPSRARASKGSEGVG